MIFEENYKAEEITIKTIEGKEYVLKSRFLPSKEVKAIEEIGFKKNITETEKAHKIMVKLFGKDEKFYSQFSIELLTRLAEYMRDIQKKN